MFQVVNRCFQIMQTRTEREWRRASSLVIAPEVHGMSWDCFESAERLIESGEQAARAIVPRLLSWLERPTGEPASAPAVVPGEQAASPERGERPRKDRKAKGQPGLHPVAETRKIVTAYHSLQSAGAADGIG